MISISLTRESARTHLRGIRRPLIILTIVLVFFLLHHFLLRGMAHGHVAHVLLGTGNAAPPMGAAVMAVSLVVVRFIMVLVVPGLLLAAGAEIVAYLLVGPKRADEDVDDLSVPSDADDVVP